MTATVTRTDWKWFGHAAHLIVGHMCRFHLATLVGAILISTVGEYWPSRVCREIHADVHDPKWLAANRHLKGDTFDAAYMKRFGFETIGAGEDSIYETMVFAAGTPCTVAECGCGLPDISGSELECRRYKTAGEASRGHYELCEQYAAQQVMA